MYKLSGSEDGQEEKPFRLHVDEIYTSTDSAVRSDMQQRDHLSS